MKGKVSGHTHHTSNKSQPTQFQLQHRNNINREYKLRKLKLVFPDIQSGESHLTQLLLSIECQVTFAPLCTQFKSTFLNPNPKL